MIYAIYLILDYLFIDSHAVCTSYIHTESCSVPCPTSRTQFSFLCSINEELNNVCSSFHVDSIL